MDQFTFHNMELTWLDGGINYLDGGTMFGPVPKVLWSRKYDVTDENKIELTTHPILIRYEGKNFLIDTGLGNNKYTDKLKRNLGITAESNIVRELEKLQLTVEDIDYVLMTHLHNDHAAGLTTWDGEKFIPTFPNAVIYATDVEWDEMRNPNIRSKATYWPQNWEAIQHQVQPFQKRLTVIPGIEMIHTGGHSNGHAVIKLTQEDETILHMGDLMPTHAHSNPLWVLAFDDYPMDSISAKERLMKEGVNGDYWYSFYHDAVYRLVKFDESGRQVVQAIERTK
ncbi:MAG TPA: MBL fold metallo-hydrolase [Sporosarcina sp.]|nr:MBL fold metallo-hydrolase [Sporosarcina sp.]